MPVIQVEGSIWGSGFNPADAVITEFGIVTVQFTSCDAGNQMWLIAQGPVNGDTAVLPALVASGAMFGDAFDPDDVVLEDWGTLTFTFTSCNAGTAMWDSTMGFGSGSANIVRLSSITGATCP